MMVMMMTAYRFDGRVPYSRGALVTVLNLTHRVNEYLDATRAEATLTAGREYRKVIDKGELLMKKDGNVLRILFQGSKERVEKLETYARRINTWGSHEIMMQMKEIGMVD